MLETWAQEASLRGSDLGSAVNVFTVNSMKGKYIIFRKHRWKEKGRIQTGKQKLWTGRHFFFF
jgi:hypothetical protein